MDVTTKPHREWLRSTLALALLGSVLLWAALPPLAFGWLGWIAPVPWLWLVALPQLPGRWPYRSLYLAGLVFWLASIHWLRLPHPLVYFGWIALSAYLAVYIPLFVGLSRVGVHRLRLPLWLVTPIVWTGLELARAHVMTGFLMASLAHTQFKRPSVIQIADLGGEYLVDFLIMLVAASATQLLRIADCRLRIEPTNPQSAIRNPKSGLLSLIPAAVALAATLIYGHWRQVDIASAEDASILRIALIQGNSLADWKLDDDRQREIMDEYVRLSHDAVARARTTGDGRPLDLIVWPETMFRVPLLAFDAEYELPPDFTQTKEQLSAAGPEYLARLAQALDTPMLVGIDRNLFLGRRTGGPDAPVTPSAAYNSAVLVARDGKILGTYDKHHLVMFGEYVPFARWLPFLGQVSTITGNVEAGAGPAPMLLDDVVISPNICYETVIPHVVRRQAATWYEGKVPPAVLINVTNDAWYWGSNELEQHLACGVFRAIETRQPLVIAANGGISAWIDAFGRVRAESPKMQPDVIIADVRIFTRGNTFYVEHGDMLSGACLVVCVVFAAVAWKTRGD